MRIIAFIAHIMAAVALMAMATACGSPTAPEPTPVPTDDAPIAASEDFEPHRISLEEAEEISSRHLAVTSWAETVTNTAYDNPELFPAALFTAPSEDCAADFVAQYRRNPNTSIDLITRCHLDAYRHSDPDVWEERHQDERTGRVRIAVAYLWQSLDHRALTASMMANRYSIDINRSEDRNYRLFAQAYEPCDTIADNSVDHIASQESATQLARAWTRTSRQLQDCSNSITQALFPSPAMGESIPIPTGEPTLPESP